MSSQHPAPRIDPLPEKEWDDLLKLVVANTGPLNIFTTLSRHPDLFHSWIGFGSMLLQRGTLSDRDRELAILRTAHLRACEYEWEQHHRLGLAAGLTEAEIAAVRLGLDAHSWSAADGAVLIAADELHADGTLSDPTWATLAARLDQRQLIELVVLIGHYHLLAFALNALRITPDAEKQQS